MDANRPFDALAAGGVLVIRIRKEFDSGVLHQGWVGSIQRDFPGPFDDVVLDMSLCGLVSSTFFAGMVQLHHHYVSGKQSPRIVVRHPDPRVVRNLNILHLAPLFTVEPR